MNAIEEWARCRHWIQDALNEGLGFETLEDVESFIVSSRYQFWPGKRSAAITEILYFPQAKVLIVRMAGGDLTELVEMEKTFCEFARATGCTKIMGEGRKGWERVCEEMGYRYGYICMEKDL